jgi:hypothetical protein
MLQSRAGTGFTGLVFITVILAGIQMITGVGTMPL